MKSFRITMTVVEVFVLLVTVASSTTKRLFINYLCDSINGLLTSIFLYPLKGTEALASMKNFK